MRIGLFQFQPVFGDVERNLRQIERGVEGPLDLLVLPELCTSGYQFTAREEVEAVAEEIPGGKTTARLAALARRIGGTVVAGIAERDRGELYNSAVVVGPEGYIGKYRKLHLFFEEKDFFAPGNLPLRTFELAQARIGVMICFDWIFPEIARTLSLQGADILVLPANLVLPYCQGAMITRAIENRVFTVVANRIGSEARGGKAPLRFTGRSQIASPKGEVLVAGPEGRSAFLAVEIGPEEARNKWITSRNHLFQDRRPDRYELC